MLYILIVIAKVDLEKFICSLLGINYDRMKLLIEYALKEQVLCIKMEAEMRLKREEVGDVQEYRCRAWGICRHSWQYLRAMCGAGGAVAYGY